MKGSAITGPVAKECVSGLLDFLRCFHRPNGAYNPFRLIYGRVSRRMLELLYEWAPTASFSSFFSSFSSYFVLHT